MRSKLNVRIYTFLLTVLVSVSGAWTDGGALSELAAVESAGRQAGEANPSDAWLLFNSGFDGGAGTMTPAQPRAGGAPSSALTKESRPKSEADKRRTIPALGKKPGLLEGVGIFAAGILLTILGFVGWLILIPFGG